MSLEIAGVQLDKLVSIEASETARFARHAVPGMDGDLTQELGRPSVRICVRGIFYGADASDQLKELRGHLLDRAPVDFVCELIGEGYFSQVVVDHLEVAQRAGRPDEFDYECVVTEYVPPPPAPTASPLGDLDAGILDEAASMMDDVQNALSQVAGLTDLLSGASDFGDPTGKLPTMLDTFKSTASGASSSLSTIGGLL
jgi:hypothetical protein